MEDEYNNGFGPITEKRGQRAQIFAAILMLVVLVFAFQLSQNGYDEVTKWLLCAAAAIWGEVIKNFCIFVEEMFHLRKRYNGSIKKAFKACFSHPNWTGYLIVAVICLWPWKTYKSSFYTLCFQHTLVQICLVPLISYLLGLKKATPAELSEINEAATKNVADGLARSFYYGYLKLILPSLLETINLSDNEVDGYAVRDHIVDHKLFIVMPKDCKCTTNFADVDPNIQFVTEAQQKILSRAGNQRRVYKNSIYKVNSLIHGEFYCLMEYATPLLSMDAMQADPRCSFTEEDRDQQVVLFYKLLKEILDKDEQCKGKYHLVLTSNARADLADVIGSEILKSRLSP